jgi:hypothetical protein
MNRDDVLKVDALKEELAGAFRQFETHLRGVFGELVYAIDTVIDHYNALEVKQATLDRQLALVTERLLVLERRVDDREH